MKPPAEWYREQDLSKHYMRRTDRPFEEGVSRGQLRRIAKCEESLMFVRSEISLCYPIINANRIAKGRTYGMTWADLQSISGDVLCWHIYSPSWDLIHAAAICVRINPSTIYCSAWGHASGLNKLSPVTFLAKGIYNYCTANGFSTMDIGVGGDPGLDIFKRRLGFRLPEEGM